METAEKKRLPKEDGQYKLVDGRIVLKKGDLLTIPPQYNERQKRRFMKHKKEYLLKLLSYPGFAGAKLKAGVDYTVEQLADLLVKANASASYTSMLWIRTSEDPVAKKLKQQLKDAEKL